MFAKLSVVVQLSFSGTIMFLLNYIGCLFALYVLAFSYANHDINVRLNKTDVYEWLRKLSFG